MSVDPNKVKSVFLKAVEVCEPGNWTEFLEEACEGDNELRRRVEVLLGAHLGEDSLFDDQAGPSPTVEQPITEKPGTQIGPYKLLQQLGEGGMGVVYMAEQKEPVKRRVALKIIKPGMDTRQVIARFEAERQALAMMDHPNIAKVLDAGATESGRPYFVMELVNGLPVTKYCDEQHLTPKERLELFVPICQAVQHAHQKGIIHRDLKPSNILVALYDGRAVPKIIDFGVAKATSQTLTEKTMFTQLGQVVGTLEYMSLEQAERNQLDIDTRSDIYSLGVVLYELLTGETPFDRARLRSAAFDEMLRIIREEEPSKPSTKVSSSQSLPSIAANRRIEPGRLGNMIRGELDWIVLKAMEKDRGRRYETASKFAEDVQHYLNGEAVVACPPSRGYRLRKFVQQNRGRLVIFNALAAALLVAIGGIGWGVRDRQAIKAAQIREHEQREQELAKKLEFWLADVDRLATKQNWEAAPAMVSQARAVLDTSDVKVELNEAVETAISELEFVSRLSEIRTARAIWLDGNSDFDHFDHDSAAAEIVTAFREFGFALEEVSPTDGIAYLQNHSRIALPLASGLEELAFYSDGNEERISQTLDIADGIDPNPIRKRLRLMMRRSSTPDLKVALGDLVESFDPAEYRAGASWRLAQLLASAEMLDEQEHVLRLAQREYPRNFWLNYSLALTLKKNDRPGEALRFITAAVAINPNLPALLSLGNSLVDSGRVDDAMACYNDVLELGGLPSAAYLGLGNALIKTNKIEEAIACYHKGLECGQLEHKLLNGLGNAYLLEAQFDDAISCYEQAIKIAPRYALAHQNLGKAFSKQEKWDEAIECYEIAIEIEPSFVLAHINLGEALAKKGLSSEAQAKYEDAIRLEHAYYGIELGNKFVQRGDFSKAIKCYFNALERNPRNAVAWSNIGSIYGQNGHPEIAIDFFKKAIEVDPSYAMAYSGLSIELASLGEYEQAIFNAEKAIEIDPAYTSAHMNLGIALSKQGHVDEAVESYRTVISLASDDKRICAAAHQALANIFRAQEKWDQMHRHFEVAYKTRELLFSNEPVDLRLKVEQCDASFNLGVSYRHRNDLERALTYFIHAKQLSQQLAAEAPDNEAYRNRLAIATRYLDSVSTAIKSK